MRGWGDWGVGVAARERGHAQSPSSRVSRWQTALRYKIGISVRNMPASLVRRFGIFEFRNAGIMVICRKALFQHSSIPFLFWLWPQAALGPGTFSNLSNRHLLLTFEQTVH